MAKSPKKAVAPRCPTRDPEDQRPPTIEVAQNPCRLNWSMQHHLISFDGIHPNEKGYAIVGPLAQAVIDKTLWK